MPKLRFLKSRGYGGRIVKVGSLIEVVEFWADKFLADGTAEAVKEKQEKAETKQPEKGKK